MMSETLIKNAIILLKDLIKIKSFSGYEDKSADKIEEWLSHNKIKFSRKYKLSRVLKFDIPKISGKTLKISKVPVRIKWILSK